MFVASWDLCNANGNIFAPMYASLCPPTDGWAAPRLFAYVADTCVRMTDDRMLFCFARIESSLQLFTDRHEHKIQHRAIPTHQARFRSC